MSVAQVYAGATKRAVKFGDVVGLRAELAKAERGESASFEATTYTPGRRPLDLQPLFAMGAFRVTYAGDGKGGYVKNDAVDSFAIVSGVNDWAPGSKTSEWPDKPACVDYALRLMETRWLDDGKYNQIVASARALGARDADLFLPVKGRTNVDR